MKQFKGVKSIEDITKTAKEHGWDIDMREFNNGGDWIWIKDTKKRMLQIKFNSFNGSFYIFSPTSKDAIATHMSDNLDNEKWYSDILDLLYA